MKALVDGDILRYEVGFAAQTAWRHLTEREDEMPPWDFVREMLDQRLSHIQGQAEADEYLIYLTEGKTFREEIAKTKPYKGNRVDNKPPHFKNLSAVLTYSEPAVVVKGIEADDAMTLTALADPDNTIICSRDKDLRQVPVNIYGWEMGNQPSFGPERVTVDGDLQWDSDRKKLSGTGLAFFAAQLLMGDPVDNIPGIPRLGQKGAYDLLHMAVGDNDALFQIVEDTYQAKVGDGWEDYLLEQGRLLWMTRKLNEDGTPVLWERGMRE